MLIDSHVNLHGEPYADDLEEVLARARAAGVGGMVAICDRTENDAAVAAIARGRANVWRSVGAHPHHAKDHRDLTAAGLIDLAAPAEVVGIGETGLDFHYEYSPRADQYSLFTSHIEAARETGLPLIIHCRDADAAMREILEREWERGAFKILLHCYTGGIDLARAAIARGGMVAFSGILAFRNADEVREVARALPLDHIILETDCPYLAPPPHRGRRNEPAYLVHVAKTLAEIKEISRDDVARITTGNFFRLFDRAERVS